MISGMRLLMSISVCCISMSSDSAVVMLSTCGAFITTSSICSLGLEVHTC